MKIFTAAALALLSFPTALIAAPRSEAEVQSLAAQSFAPLMEEFNVPGLVVGITYGGQDHYFSAGVAARAEGTAATPDTLFELGSISKLFTATLATMAEGRGHLDLNQQVADHVPELAGTAFGELSLLELATHQSGGLPLQVPDTTQTTEELVEWLRGWRPDTPGARSYSNISIGLLGHITANALNRDFAGALEEDLFPVLGLGNTWVDVPDQAMQRYAFGYDRKTDRPIRVSPGVLDSEAYGVKSSARDMVRFLNLHLGHAEVSDELSTALAKTRHGLAQTEAYVQGMIWEQYPWPVAQEQMIKGNSYAYILNPQPMRKLTPALPPQEHVILNKTGATNGFGAYVVLLPGKDLGVVMLANRNIPNEARIRATYGFVQKLLTDPQG